MAWSAIDALDDARESTQSFLVPVDRGRWLRLAVIALFVGGVGGGNVSSTGGVPGDGGGPGTGPLPSPDVLPVDALVGALVAAVVLVAALAVVWAAVGAVMEFVLVEAVVTRDVRIREPFRDHLGRGLRLFGFRVAVALAALVLVAVPAALVVLGGVAVSVAFLVLLVPLVVLLVAVGIAVFLLGRLTTDLVVPTMLAEGCGVLAGWRRLLPALREQWRAFAVFVIVRVVLGVVAAVVVGLVAALLALVVAVPALVVAGVGFVVADVAAVPIVAWAGVAVAVLLFVLALVALLAAVQVPVVTFFRYYSLFVLGAEVSALDLVADLRDGDDGADASEAEQDDEDDGADASEAEQDDEDDSRPGRGGDPPA